MFFIMFRVPGALKGKHLVGGQGAASKAAQRKARDSVSPKKLEKAARFSALQKKRVTRLFNETAVGIHLTKKIWSAASDYSRRVEMYSRQKIGAEEALTIERTHKKLVSANVKYYESLLEFARSEGSYATVIASIQGELKSWQGKLVASRN